MAHDPAMNGATAAVSDSGMVGNQFLNSCGMSTTEIFVTAFVFLLIAAILTIAIYSLYVYAHKPGQ